MQVKMQYSHLVVGTQPQSIRMISDVLFVLLAVGEGGGRSRGKVTLQSTGQTKR